MQMGLLKSESEVLSLMKRLCCFFILCMMLFFIPASYAETVQEQFALAVVDAIVNGNYDAVASRFSDEFEEKMDAQDLRETYESLKALLGEYWGVHSVEQSKLDDTQLVLVRCAYEKHGLAISISIEEEKISGLDFQLVVLEGIEGLEYPLDMTSREMVFLREGEADETPAKLVVPDGEGTFPAVVFLADSGAQDKDASTFANRPFYDIAEGLARTGIASIRYDKYTYLHTGSMTEAELARLTMQEEYINDALCAIEILKADSRIGDIYIVGHGLGAKAALRVIQAAGKENIAGAVLLSSSTEPLWLDLAKQSTAAMTAEQQESYMTILLEQMELANKLDTLTEAELLEKTILGMSAYYHYDEQSVDAVQAALENAVPLFIAQGALDWQISDGAGIETWKEALKDASFPVEYKLYDNLNHLLIPQEGEVTKTMQDYAAEGKVSEEVISDIAAFILGE